MKTNINIELVMRDRLTLQYVQNKISNNYGISFPRIEKFTNNNFLTKFSTWDYDKQKSLLIDLGGPANYKYTRYWMNGLIRNLTRGNDQNKGKINEENLRIHTE